MSYLLEAEAFPTRTGGAIVSDPAADGGAAWSTTSASSISHSWFAEHPGTYRVAIIARGVAAGGILPQVTIFTDGRAIGHFQVSGGYARFHVDDTVEAGTKTIRILFENPGSVSGVARTLVVDSAQVELIGNNEPRPVWGEVESFPTKTQGAAFPDFRASEGRAWNLWSNGHVRMSFSVVAPTTFRASVWARADLPDATPAQMQVRVDGEIAGSFLVSSERLWTEYRTNFSVASGSHTFDIFFLNDMNNEVGDRNLGLDAVKLLPIGSGDPPPAAVRRFEVESFPSRSNGGIYIESTASGGKGWKQWSNGAATMTLEVERTQNVEFAIRARGSVASNEWPLMRLVIDGTVRAEWSVMGGNYAVYSDPETLTQGTHTIAIAFVNDARTATEDRNLYLDSMDVGGAAAPPPSSPTAPPPSSSPTRIEVESFASRSGGGVFGDAAASGGQGWNQWSDGVASTQYALAGPLRLEFTIRAKGSPVNGGWPTMDLRVDGRVVGQWTVSSRDYALFRSTQDVGAGTHAIGIGFTNDLRTATEDRNLYLDHLELRAVGAGSQPPTTSPTTPPTASPPPVISPPLAGRSEWTQSGFDVYGSHFNRYESTISAANASKLKLAWSYVTPRAIFSTPAVVNGVAYFGDTAGNAVALKVDTGALVWKNTDAPGGIANNMAVGEGRVYHGKAGGEVVARDAATGKILWRVRPESHPNAAIWSSPLFHAGKIYIGMASTQESAGHTTTPDFRGSFFRLDAATGATDWQYYIVPPGYTGGAMWTTAALDPEAGIVYLGTGNAYTEPAHQHTDAILALDMKTGALRWATQGFANDVWTATNPDGPDTDFAMPVMVWNTTKGEKLVGAGNKIGDFFALDHDTGAIIYRVHPQKVGQGFFGPGAYAYGRLYAALDGDKAVIAMDPDTGTILWRAAVSAGFTGGVTVSNGALFTATHDGAVWAFDAMTGAKLFQSRVPGTEGMVFGTPSVADNTLLVPYFQSSWATGTGGVAAFRVGQG